MNRLKLPTVAALSLTLLLSGHIASAQITEAEMAPPESSAESPVETSSSPESAVVPLSSTPSSIASTPAEPVSEESSVGTDASTLSAAPSASSSALEEASTPSAAEESSTPSEKEAELIRELSKPSDVNKPYPSPNPREAHGARTPSPKRHEKQSWMALNVGDDKAKAIAEEIARLRQEREVDAQRIRELQPQLEKIREERQLLDARRDELNLQLQELSIQVDPRLQELAPKNDPKAAQKNDARKK